MPAGPPPTMATSQTGRAGGADPTRRSTIHFGSSSLLGSCYQRLGSQGARSRMVRRATPERHTENKERSGGMKTQKVTIHTLRQMKERGEKIAMLTAYDATFARLLDEAGADVLLVGDSLGMVIQGHETTLPVTLEEIGYHCRAVARGARRAHVV